MSSARHPSKKRVAEMQAHAAANPGNPAATVTEQMRLWYEARRAKNRERAARGRNRDLVEL